ncbi:MAG: type II toxin-antitoxin system PemK/MazF family toxin [Candidatus Riflebacteria bacterium]|nr:type II toxin-antitoxin system PemK/MazF family toxin [Candidatus Riflebacteria bacterium]
MTSFKKGEIYLSEIVFTDGTATKKRPIVVVSGKHFNEKREEVVVAPITSNVIRKIYGDVTIKHWEAAGLLFPSAVTGIITTIKKTMLEKKIGQLDKEDLLKVEECLRKNLELQDNSGKSAGKA